ncbi:MAG: ribosome maturation factor RimP, partial [Kiloniellales bacterium]
VEALIAPALGALGYEIVRVILTGERRPVLQIMVERQDGVAIGVEDCAEVSRTVSALLDVEEPITSAYTLEVSSPGIDRPLTRLADFERFAGFEARVELNAPRDGRRRFSGRLLGVAGETVRLKSDTGEVALPFDAIAKAKLLLTDALIAASQEGIAGRSTGGQ